MPGYETNSIAILLVIAFWSLAIIVAAVPAGLVLAVSMIFGLEIAFGVWLICCGWGLLVLVAATAWRFFA